MTTLTGMLYLQDLIQIQSLDVTLHSTWHAGIHCRAPTQHDVVIQRHPVVHVHLLYCNQVAYQTSSMLQCCPYQLGMDSICIASSLSCRRVECSAAFPFVGCAVPLMTTAESHSAALLLRQEQMPFAQKMQAGDEPQPDLNAVEDIL